MPLNAAIDAVAPSYAADQTGKPRRDWNIPGHAFRRLCALSELDRRLYGAAVRSFWRTREDSYFRDYYALLADAAAKWSCVPEKSRKSLTDWIIAEQTRNFFDANRLFDDLTWQIIQNNRTKGDGNLKWKPEPFVAHP